MAPFEDVPSNEGSPKMRSPFSARMLRLGSTGGITSPAEADMVHVLIKNYDDWRLKKPKKGKITARGHPKLYRRNKNRSHMATEVTYR